MSLSNVGVTLTPDETIERGANISACGHYRYTLWRKWAQGGTAMFVGLNPSTADATLDDPTIRRCIGFARAWGYGSLCMLNLFAYRATQPADMLAQTDPVGPENDDWLLRMTAQADVVVAAWGTHGAFKNRDEHVRSLLGGNLSYLKLTSGGHPGHPLYLPASLCPTPWARGGLGAI